MCWQIFIVNRNNGDILQHEDHNDCCEQGKREYNLLTPAGLYDKKIKCVA